MVDGHPGKAEEASLVGCTRRAGEGEVLLMDAPLLQTDREAAFIQGQSAVGAPWRGFYPGVPSPSVLSHALTSPTA